MSLVRRRLVPLAVGGLLGGLACGPLIGLDELRARVSDAGSDSASDAAPDVTSDAPTCTSNAQCIDAASGQAALCVSGRCVQVDSQICLPQVEPSIDTLRDDNVALFAAFVPVLGENALNLPSGRAFSLALREIAKAGGIPGTKRRPVAMVFCGSEQTNDVVGRGMRHVTHDLRVPAVISGFDDLGMTKFVEEFGMPNDIFMLNPGVTTYALKYRDVKRLVWNLLGTPEDVALAYRPLLERTEPYALNRSGRVPGPLRVALLTTDTPTEEAIATILREGPKIRSGDAANERDLDKALVFNGKSTGANGVDFKPIRVAALENNESPAYATIKAELTAFRPDVVIALTRDEIKVIVEDLESAITGDGGAEPLPIWLLSPRNAREILPYLASATAEQFVGMRKRFLGVQYAGAVSQTERTAWLARMADAYPKVDPGTYSAAENFYDAVYWLTYGLAAAGPGTPTNGESIRDGVRNLLYGPVIHPGPKDSIDDAFRQISSGDGDTTFVGALGAPDIDNQFGTWNSVGGVYCYTDNGTSIAPRYDVLRYNASTGALDGTFDCFIGF